MPHNILDDLEKMVKSAAAKKAEALEKEAQDTSSKLDSADDGTSPATTGEQAAAQISAQNETYPDNAADTGANDNEAGASVDKSTEGATAVATDGDEGAQGADLSVKKDADNGEEKPENKVDGNGGATGAFKTAAADARETAAQLNKLAQDILSPLDRFLVKAAKASNDSNVKTAAEGMGEDELADAAAASLLEQIEAGELSDEEAAQILDEAVSSGAVDPAELEAIAAEAEGAPAEAGGAPVEEAPDMMPGLDKVAAASDVGPDHPEYLHKLASLYPEEMQAGFNFAVKLAEELGEEENDESEEAEEEEAETEAPSEGDEGGEESDAEGDDVGGAIEEEIGVPAAESGAPVEEAPPMDPFAAGTPEEAEALAAVGQELGMDEAALAQLMQAPIEEAPKMALAKAAQAMKDAGIDPASRYRATIMNKVAALK